MAMSQRASALRAKGERILDFSVGEPDQETPRRVSLIAAAALEAGKTRYTPAAGIPQLRAAVASRYRQDFGVGFAPEEVVITNGGKHGLYTVFQCLLDAGDEVVVPSPYWPTFTEAVRLAGGRPVVVPASEKDGFRITPGLLRKAVSSRTRAVVINTPCNPTGAVIDPEDLLAIGEMAKRRGFTLLYDDTYAHLSYGRAERFALQPLREALGERFVIVGTASKSYCMTGWRIGWVMAGKPLAEACTAVISHSTSCPTSFAQEGAIEALTGPQEFVSDLAEEYRRRRDLIHRRISAIPGVACLEPAGGFYLFPNVKRHLGRGVRTSLELSLRLLEETKVAVVPGEGFGAPGYVRISFARPMQELEDGAARIASFLGRQR
jgi:aspartate aminotransferase